MRKQVNNTVNHQFKPIPGTVKKNTPKEQPTPANQGAGDLSVQKMPAIPHAPKEQPYLQTRHDLPGIPVLPGSTPKKGNLRNFAPPPFSQSHSGQSREEIFNRPKQVALHGLPAGINPGNVYSSMKNNKDNPLSAGGNFSGSPNNSRPLSTDNPAFDSVAGNPYPSGRPLISNFQGMQGGPNYPQGGVVPQRIASRPLEPEPPRKKGKKRIPTWARIAIGVLIFLIVVTGGAFGYYEIAIAPSLNNILGKQAIHHTDTNGEGTLPTGRTNILLLGSDTDGKGNDPNNGGATLAQTVMIITVDPQTNYVGMLSIPRDMQVTENGYPEPKLDEVFAHGMAGKTLQNRVASGAGEMEDIIQANFGIHIDHYAWVGLGGFIKVIDTAGGIDIDTIHPMVDDTYPDDVGNSNGSIYDYKRLYIPPGPQHLNGAEALNYVRTRHSDLVGDFGRTVRQQQVISQLKTKLATPDTLGKASELLQDLNGAVQTDMQLSDVIGLGNLARNIDNNSVDRLTLGPPDYAVANINGGRPTNYLPICENIVPKIQKMFNVSTPNCVSQAMSNTTTIARTTPSTTTAALTGLNATVATEPEQSSMLRNTNQHNTHLAAGGNALTEGIHGLLDMLFATTFESFDAMQI